MWAAIVGFATSLLWGIVDRLRRKGKVVATNQIQAPASDRKHAAAYLRRRLRERQAEGGAGSADSDEPGHAGADGHSEDWPFNKGSHLRPH